MKPALWRSLFPGIALTAFIASVGFMVAQLPLADKVGPLAAAILSAVLYRHFFGYPEKIHSGIQFSAKKLLRLAIILFGLKLNMNVIWNEGLPLLVRDLLVILFAIGLMMILARLFKADESLSMLLGIGTGVCGASAIAAVSPILKAKEEDTAISAGIISIVGTVFAIGYTIIRPWLPVDAEAYGMWVGLSLHEVAHVALAGAAAGDDGLGMALLGKLGRVFLLVPLSLVLIAIMRKSSKSQGDHTIAYPWFLVGFILMSLFGSYVNGNLVVIPTPVMEGVSFLTSFLLTMAMVGLGLNVSLRDLRQKAWKPMLLLLITSLLLSFLTYWIV
ncbi:putative sulfate exporter family transporter [Halobacillus yeomjeoni]|uniref:YeiH family protein n=1 Tax=Halobacillus yeomjeoni TaxID=311194 RepID=UPI001CD676C2|nr:putative sulfate exporter family transporter [Halobacillus yeomjeoni]MCA0985029.1 putative sulfate exporter family transporter [Halobacillus yeomjeoni]